MFWNHVCSRKNQWLGYDSSVVARCKCGAEAPKGGEINGEEKEAVAKEVEKNEPIRQDEGKKEVVAKAKTI